MLSKYLFSNKLANYLLAACVVVTLLPFVLLCLYIHPHYDDYVILNKLTGRNVFEATIYWYKNWTGRYSTLFIDSIMAHGTRHLLIYRLYPILLMLIWIVTFVLFFRTVLSQTLISTKKTIFVSLIFFVLYLYKIPEITSGLYYLTCAYTCALGTIALINLITVFILMLRDETGKKRIQHLLMACLLAIFIGGSYEPVMLVAILFLIALSWFIYKKNKKFLYSVLILCLVIVSGILLVIAPGNNVRAGTNLLAVSPHHLIATLLQSFSLGSNLVLNTVQSPMLLVCTLLFIPVATGISEHDAVLKKYLDINPVLIFLGIFIMASAGFAPSVWTEGSSPARITNQLYVFVYLGWFLGIQTTVIYFIKKGITINLPQNLLWVIKLLLVVCLIPSLTNKTVARAYSDLISRAPEYNRRLNERDKLITQLKEQGKKSIVLPVLFDDYTRYPLTIYYNYQELNKDPCSKVNRIYAEHWGVDSITVENTTAVDFLNKSRLN